MLALKINHLTQNHATKFLFSLSLKQFIAKHDFFLISNFLVPSIAIQYYYKHDSFNLITLQYSTRVRNMAHHVLCSIRRLFGAYGPPDEKYT
ncbi:Uncharacterized protein HZ326_21973 [Fusarium oxysporum f. sp. albedinis]|nr:Uncharacterized protein HZ326_21973 [Fusarium oxysporum f. sp. albedinis]